MAIAIEQIIKLRNITNSGIADCKKALEEANGNIDEAVVLIRKMGKQISQKRSQNDISAGVSFSAVNAECDFAIIGSVKCETDFGANSSTVSDFIKEVCKYAIENRCKCISEIKIGVPSTTGEITLIPANEALEEIVTTQIREKAVLTYDFIEGSTIFNYTHFNKRVSVLLKCDLTCVNTEENGNNDKTKENAYSICNKICLQVACCDSILGLCRNDVDEKSIKSEMVIAEEKAKNAKNDNIRKCIIEGYMNEFYKETVLTEQPYMDDHNILVKDLLSKNNIKVIDYKRVKTF